MATTRSTGFVVTAAIWNAVLSGLNDAGNVFTGVSATLSGALTAASLTLSGALSAATGAFSGAVTMASTLIASGAVQFTSTLNVVGLATLDAGLKERGRSVAMGEWIVVPFSSADFITTTAVNWTVQSGDLVDFRYTLQGKTMTLAFYITTSSVSGTGSHLLLEVPGGFQCASQNTNAIIHVNNAGAGDAVGLAVAGSDPDYILLASTLGGGTWNTATNNTTVRGQITFQIA